MSLLVKHFVGRPKILLEIESLGLDDSGKKELENLITLLYHQKLLNCFLEYLAEEDKKIFMELVVSGTNEVYLEFLHQKIEKIEEIVESAVVEIEKQIVEHLESLVKN